MSGQRPPMRPEEQETIGEGGSLPKVTLVCNLFAVLGSFCETMLNSKPADLTALTMVGITVFKLSGQVQGPLGASMKIGGKRVRIQP